MPAYQGDSADHAPDELINSEPPIFSPTLCFVLGLTVLLPILPEARLTLFDVVAGILMVRYWRATIDLIRSAIVILGISLLAMALSAYLNGSELRALLSRSYAMVALIVEIGGYCLLIIGANDKGRALLVLGAMLGICCHYFYPADPRILDSAIKFLIGIPLGVGLLSLYALAIPRASASVVLIATLMVAYALFCFVVGARSIGGVYFVSAIFVAVIGLVRIPNTYARLAPVIMLAAGTVGYAFTELYTALATRGYFGDRAAGIAIFQSSFGSILLGGRPEIVINLAGIKDSPLFGAGITNYPSIYLYELINLLVYSSSDVIDTDNILYHSALFGTAFESGLIAALFWAYLLYITLFCIPLLSNMRLAARSFCMPLLIITVWHIVYSPPIPYNRFVMSFGLAVAFYLYSGWKQRQRQAHMAPSLLPSITYPP